MSQATSTFVHQVTVIEAEWCNDTDLIVHEVFPGDISLPYFKVDALGNKILNNTGSALATNATDGFVMLPTSAGTPTGTPAGLQTGVAPIHIDETNDRLYIYTNSAWHEVGATTPHVETPQWICLAAADQTTVFTTGTAKASILAMPAGEILAIRAFTATAGSTSSTFDVNLNGTTIMSSNKLLIDANENSTLTASTAPALTTTSIASGDTLSVDIDSAGTGAKGWGILLQVRWS